MSSREDRGGNDYGVLANDIRYIQRDIENIRQLIEHQYVTQDQFDPIRKIVYGLVSVVLTSVMVGLLALILRR